MKKLLITSLFALTACFIYAQQAAGTVQQATPVMKVDATPAEHPVTETIQKTEVKACCQQGAPQGKSCCQQPGAGAGCGQSAAETKSKKKKGK